MGAAPDFVAGGVPSCGAHSSRAQPQPCSPPNLPAHHNILHAMPAPAPAPSGRLTEVERKVRAVDERAAKLDVTEATVADLVGRVGGMEDSLAHLAQVIGSSPICCLCAGTAPDVTWLCGAVVCNLRCFKVAPLCLAIEAVLICCTLVPIAVGRGHEGQPGLAANGCGAAQNGSGCPGAAPAAGRCRS